MGHVFEYYELGPDDPPYAAKSWDCCGSEDAQAQGCKPLSTSYMMFEYESANQVEVNV